jgi:hypothetical protein
MRIRYENSIDDFVALARFHNDHSPAARRVRVRATWVFAIVSLAVTAFFGFKVSELLDEQGWGQEGRIFSLGIVSFLVLCILGAIIRMPGGFRRSAERHARRMYAEGANKGVLGPRELELVGNDLISRSAYAESRLRLEIVERVVTDEDYTFIFINAVTAYIIPHDTVSEGNLEKFTEAINNRIFPPSY